MPRASTTWAPGRSGNPSGRPKVITEVRDVARTDTEEAIMTLVAIMTARTAIRAAVPAAMSATG